MKKKIFLCIFFIAILVLVTFFAVQSFTKEKEEKITDYIPQEEISEVQDRQTLVTLYFQNRDTKMLMPEARLIDVKLLIENPYATLINLLLEGPKNDKLEQIIPVGTRLNSVKVMGDTAIVDFSEEFIKDVNVDKEADNRIVNSIVNTLTQLTEIESVKFLINGEEGKGFIS